MSPELDAKLVADFPNLYKDRHGDMTKTCMVWGFPGDGWEPLIRRLSEKLEPLGAVAVQVKEKFGTLRFYASNDGHPEVEVAIREAEEESARTCENCGKPGRLYDIDWLVTLCEECVTSRFPSALEVGD